MVIDWLPMFLPSMLLLSIAIGIPASLVVTFG